MFRGELRGDMTPYPPALQAHDDGLVRVGHGLEDNADVELDPVMQLVGGY